MLNELPGLALGLEMEFRGHAAGLRTHGLMLLSSALLTVAGMRLVLIVAESGGESDPLRVVQGIAQAWGFIGRGWSSSPAGMCGTSRQR